ncbi:YesL family protein [Neobacillus dielmonensis]|uniref:YesL family protein n=1 Tax=Neobacillus dielmonensis TaxID=1347369 RepID=UPI0005AB1C7C|nr:DUF624 domain-containing protein [Neobacillus dielmonensis]
MEQTGLMGGFYRVSEWIFRLIYVNVLWILFTLLGGIILGVMPATAAAFEVSRKWFKDLDEVSVFRAYWESYRINFIQSNLLGLLLSLAGGILFIYHQSLGVMPEQWNLIFKIFFYSMLLVYSIIVAFILPVFAHFQVSLFAVFKNTLVIGLSYPHYAFLNLMVVSISFVIFQFVPILALFFGISVNAVLIMKVSFKVFMKIEAKQSEKNGGGNSQTYSV